MPKVSVIMACHNAEPYIENAIASVVNQTFLDLELIIVDDASHDQSLILAQRAAFKDSRIEVHSLLENVGAGAARNIGIEIARGEWLAILDADDVFLLDKLQEQLNHLMSSRSDIVLVGSNSFEIDCYGNRFGVQKYSPSNEILKSNLIKLKRFPPHSSLIYKAEAVRSVGGFNNRYRRSEDYDLWLRLMPLGTFNLIPKPLVEYRHHGANISKTNAGIEQLKYGFATVTCHFIRERNVMDPSRCESVQEWDAFLSWLVDRLDKKGQLRSLQITTEWRKEVRERGNSRFAAASLGGFVLRHPVYSWRLVKEKLLGNDLPQQLADEWINFHVRLHRDS